MSTKATFWKIHKGCDDLVSSVWKRQASDHMSEGRYMKPRGTKGTVSLPHRVCTVIPSLPWYTEGHSVPRQLFRVVVSSFKADCIWFLKTFLCFL